MVYESQFLTLSEIGIALAGFAGLTVALLAGSSRGVAKQSRARVVAVLTCGVVVVVFAYLPAILSGLTPSQALAWRIAQLIFASYHFFSFYNHRRIGGAVAMNAMEKLLFPMAFVVASAQMVTGVGFFAEYLPVIYLLGLVWFVFAGAWHFGNLIVENIPSSP